MSLPTDANMYEGGEGFYSNPNIYKNIYVSLVLFLVRGRVDDKPFRINHPPDDRHNTIPS